MAAIVVRWRSKTHILGRPWNVAIDTSVWKRRMTYDFRTTTPRNWFIRSLCIGRMYTTLLLYSTWSVLYTIKTAVSVEWWRRYAKNMGARKTKNITKDLRSKFWKCCESSFCKLVFVFKYRNMLRDRFDVHLSKAKSTVHYDKFTIVDHKATRMWN